MANPQRAARDRVLARLEEMAVTDGEAHFLLGYLTDGQPALVSEALDQLEEHRRRSRKEQEGKRR